MKRIKKMRKIPGRRFIACALAFMLLWGGEYREASALYGREMIQQEEPDVSAPLEDISLYATSAVLMDADSGRILYEKAGHEKMSMASTTKIMTCIIALEYGNLEDEVDISAYAAGMPKVKLYVRKGEKYILQDLLYSLMLESHNDVAAAVAEHIGKAFLPKELRNKSVSEYTAEESRQAVAAFAHLMNQKAIELGCRDTWFITPNGLDASETFTLESGEVVTKEHSTTAANLARIMAYCVGKSPQSEKFLQITRCASYSFTANGRSFSCSNHNAFLNMMDGALSGKTGFTNKAGYCYVGALRRDEKTYVVALLACGWPNNKNYKWSDTRELMEYGLEHYEYHAFAEEAFDAKALPAVAVADGQTGVLNGTALVPLTLSEKKEGLDGLLLREDEKVQVECDVPKELTAPVEAGEIVGSVRYKVGGVVYRTEYIQTADSVAAIDLKWCLVQIWRRFAL